MRRFPSLLFFFVVMLGLLLAAGCDSVGPPTSEESGTLELHLTGASTSASASQTSTLHSSPLPNDSLQEARVTLSAISIVPAADTSEGDSTETGISVLRDENVEVDLVDLQTGLDTTLAELEIPTGTYSQIRLITAGEAQITFQDGRQYGAMIASGPQTGLKVNFSPSTIDSSEDRVEVTLAWNVEESLKGNPRGQLVITPVIQATVDTSSPEE